MNNNSKQIVIIESYPTDYLAKISKSLKKKGYETILIILTGDPESPFLKESYDKIISFNAKFFATKIKSIPNILFYSFKKIPELLRLNTKIKKLRPYVVLGKGPPNWFCFLSMKYFRKSPFIYFPYDIRADGYKDLEEAKKFKIPLFEFKAEKYCFEKSDGVAHKGEENELEHINEKILGKLTIKQPTFHFLTYSSEDLFVPIEKNKQKLSKKNKDIHLVFVGGLSTTEEWLKSIKKILDSKIHLHLYGKYANLTKEEDYQRLVGYKDFLKSKYFHLEGQLDQKDLAKVISRYDYATWLVHYDIVTKIIRKGTGNKLATYLEAGLPIIYYSHYERIGDILKKYGAGISMEWNDSLPELLKKQDYKKLIKNVEKARKDLGIDKNIIQIEEFFEEVRNHKFNK